MKPRHVLLLFVMCAQAGAECYQGAAKDGSITGLRHDATLVFKRVGSAGGRGFLAAVDKRGFVVGEVRCAGGGPDTCSFGSDGGPGKFQFLDNVPTIEIDLGKLFILSGDGDEKDLRAPSRRTGPGFNYRMEVADQKVCTDLFKQPADEPRRQGRPRPPAVSVPITR
jgi:hypothetical protein